MVPLPDGTALSCASVRRTMTSDASAAVKK
jgi:hypothetical protein